MDKIRGLQRFSATFVFEDFSGNPAELPVDSGNQFFQCPSVTAGPCLKKLGGVP